MASQYSEPRRHAALSVSRRLLQMTAHCSRLVLLWVAIVALGPLCGPESCLAECEGLGCGGLGCANVPEVFIVAHDSAFSATNHRFSVYAEIQAFDASMNGLGTAVVRCVAGGSSGQIVQCSFGLGDSIGCVSATLEGTIDVGGCGSAVVFELSISSIDDLSHGCKCYFQNVVAIPWMLEVQPDLGTIGCPERLSDPVSALNGNLNLERTDVVLGTDVGLPIVFTRHYNSYRPEDAPDPAKMWTYGYDIRLYESYRWYTRNSPWSSFFVGPVTLVKGDGQAVVFHSCGTISAPQFEAIGSDYSLDYDCGTDTYTVSTDDGTRICLSWYDSLSYRATQIIDRNGNSVTLEYLGSNLSRISLDSLRYFDILYYAAASCDVPRKIVSSDGDTLATYSYADTLGFLTQVTYADGSWEQYTAGTTADDLNRIVQATNSDGTTWHWGYDYDHRVNEAYNNVSPDVEHVSLSFNWYAEGDTTIVVDSTGDTTYNVDITDYWYETEVENNHVDSQTTTYTSWRHPYGVHRLLMSVTDNNCAGCGKQFTYDGREFRNSVEYANGRVDSMKYDDYGNINTLTFGANTSEPFRVALEYDTVFHLPTKVATPSVVSVTGSREIVLVRDAQGNMEYRIESGWIDDTTTFVDTTTFEYNDRGQLTKVDGPRSDVADTMAFRYDATTGDLQQLLLPNGDTVWFGPRDAGIGTVPYVIDPNGIRTEFTYDDRGRLRSILENALTDDSVRTSFDLNFKGALTELTLPSGLSYAFNFNANDWLTSLFTGAGDSIAFGYDNMSNLASVRYYDTLQQLKMVDSFTYNWKSQLVEHDAYEYHYNEMGQPDIVVVPTHVDSTLLEYDLFGRLTQIAEVSDSGPYVTTQFDYDAHGNLTEVIDPDGYVFAFRYDDRGLLVRDSCAVTGVTTYTYDDADNLASRTDAKGVTVAFSYDAMNRLIAVSYPNDSLDVTYRYDSTIAYGGGRLAAEQRLGDTIEYAYDAFGRVIQERHTTAEGTYLTDYSYTVDGDIETVTYPSGVAYTYLYDAEGRVNRVEAQFGGGQTQVIADSITYLPFGGIKSIKYGNGIKTTYRYDTSYRLLGISTGSDAVLRRSYQYDSVGNITFYRDSLTSLNNTTYTYDHLNRLCTIQRESLPHDKMEFQYYGNDNRWRRIIYTDTTEQAQSPQPLRPPIIYNPGAPRDIDTTTQRPVTPLQRDTTLYSYAGNRLMSLSGVENVAYGYDNNGNLASQVDAGEEVWYEYDQANRLVFVDKADTLHYYTYNCRSQRRSYSWVAGTSAGAGVFVYARNGLLLSEYDPDEWLVDYVYLHGLPIAQLWAYNEVNGQDTTTHFDVTWYHLDHLGTPQAMTNSNKTIFWKTQYFAFGYLCNESATATPNIRFPGQYHDRKTDLHYNMYRYYRPDVGRYMTPDPIGIAGGLNLYSYAGQNPVNNADPRGLDWYERPNGDLVWYDETENIHGPLGAWFAEKLVYQKLNDRGLIVTDEISGKVNSIIPNVTADFRQLMSGVKTYGWALRAVSWIHGFAREAGMVSAYAWHMPCDIENTRPPYNNHNYVRLFGEVVENDDPGNILFGYGASEAGYSPETVLIAAGIVQLVGDVALGESIKSSPTYDAWKDIPWLLKGINLYRTGGIW